MASAVEPATTLEPGMAQVHATYMIDSTSRAPDKQRLVGATHIEASALEDAHLEDSVLADPWIHISRRRSRGRSVSFAHNLSQDVTD